MWILKNFKTVLLYLLYRRDISNQKIAYMLAEEKGMYCEGLRNGIAKFDQNRPPQEEPTTLRYREFYKRINDG